ncbi:MAG: hypothetical protein MAG453_00381 [Calditrichaeota bacterium]|nr:hypothetical protein [Calditrichota bacterium]
MNHSRSARAQSSLAVVLAVIVVAAAVAVAAIMFAPSDRDAVVAALTEKGRGIIEAAQTYPDRFRTAETDTTGPFTGLRFDRIGYFDRLSVDARTLLSDTGRFTLFVSGDGSSFTLDAVGADGIRVRWEGVTADSIPPPEM